jgi:hypothetical protein
VTRDILRGMFLGANGISTAGIALPLAENGGEVIVRLSLCAILADEEALNAMFWIKGASGVVPCATLCNVLNKQSPNDIAQGVLSMAEFDESLADISCSSLEKCQPRSDEDVWTLCDQLKDAPPGELVELEQCTGIKLNLDTLLYDLALRVYVWPSSHTCSDPMHILFSNGLLAAEVMLFMKSMKQSVGAYFADVRENATQWIQGRPCRVYDAINEYREEHSDEMLKAGASELMSAYPLIRAFAVLAYGAAAQEPFVASFLLLCLICDEVRMLVAMPDSTCVEDAARRLEELITKYLDAFVNAYGKSKCRFKHHQLLHLPEMIRRLKRMISCWVTERKHISMKLALQYCNRHKCATSHGMAKMLNVQVAALEKPGWMNRLGDSSKPYPELAFCLKATHVAISSNMRWLGCTVKAKDVVFINRERTQLVVVVACLGIDKSFALLARSCVCTSCMGTASSWDADPDFSLLHLSSTHHLAPVAFSRFASANKLEILH